MTPDERLRQCIATVEDRLEHVRTGVQREHIFREDMNMPNVVVDRVEALLHSVQFLLGVARERSKGKR